MFKQGSNFLWQLAMSKAQHKMKMEESDRLLALEKIESEKERAREQAKLKESREYTEGQEAKKKLSSYAEKGRKTVTGEEQEALSITGAPQLQTKGMVYDPIAQAFVEPSEEESYKPTMKTYVYPDGKIKTIDVNKITPPEGALPIKHSQKGKKTSVWMHNPKLKRKIQAKPSEVSNWEAKGYVRGQPYGATTQKDPMVDLQRISKEYKTPDSFFERIVLDSWEKKRRLKSWLVQSSRLRKRGKFSRELLLDETLAIMADLGFPEEYHDTVSIMLSDPKVREGEVTQLINEISDEKLEQPE
jgi:hypothetical protein